MDGGEELLNIEKTKKSFFTIVASLILFDLIMNVFFLLGHFFVEQCQIYLYYHWTTVQIIVSVIILIINLVLLPLNNYLYRASKTERLRVLMNLLSILYVAVLYFGFGMIVKSWLVFLIPVSFDIAFLLLGHSKQFWIQSMVVFAIPIVVIAEYAAYWGEQPGEFFFVALIILNLKWEHMDEIQGMYMEADIPWRILAFRSFGFLGYRYRV